MHRSPLAVRPLTDVAPHLRRLSGAAALALLSTVFATGASAQADEARFQIERISEDEVLRLDRQTGEVELCATSTPTFVCRTVVAPTPTPEPSAGVPASGEILAENQALRLENAQLKRRLGMIAALVSDTEATDVKSTSSLVPPDARREIDEALDVTSYAVRRFQDLFKTLTEDSSTN